MSQAAAVIDLEEFRKRREARPVAVRASTPPTVWTPVWVWVMVWPS